MGFRRVPALLRGFFRGDPGMDRALEVAEGGDTGGKDQCTGLVHHKYIARKWTVYHACAHPVHHKYFQNFPCWFPHDVPSQETASTFTVFQVM